MIFAYYFGYLGEILEGLSERCYGIERWVVENVH